MMIWSGWDHYLPSEDDGKHPYALPLQAQDLSNLPPTMMFNAEYDPLRDKGEQYASHLQEAGNKITVMRYNGMIHGFFGMGAVVDQGKQAIEDVAASLRSAFGSE